MKAHVLILLLIATTALVAGCGTTPATPEAAVPVARNFMEARAARNAGTLYGLLTQTARTAMTRALVADYVQLQTVRYERLGAPITRDDGWVQVPVTNLTVTTSDSQTRWPEALLTLRHDGKRWLVAWADPLMAAAMNAYANGAPSQELDFGRAVTDVDPHHYRGPLEIHFAYRGLKRPREAEIWLIRAASMATPSQVPDVEDAWARFKLSLEHPEDAIPHARAALEKAAPYIPDLYSRRWQVDTMVVLGRALLARGDRTGALDMAQQAGAIAPESAQLAMFRQVLNPPTQP